MEYNFGKLKEKEMTASELYDRVSKEALENEDEIKEAMKELDKDTITISALEFTQASAEVVNDWIKENANSKEEMARLVMTLGLFAADLTAYLFKKEKGGKA